MKDLTTGFEGKRHGVHPQNGMAGFSLHFPKVWKMKKKSGIMKSGLDAMPLFLLDDLLSATQSKFQAGISNRTSK